MKRSLRSFLLHTACKAECVQRHQHARRSYWQPSSAQWTPPTARREELATTQYTCPIETEPLYRYRSRGYHPVELGDVLDGRYTILHKLGWGGYSTVWAASDRREHRIVAVKIAIAERSQKQEVQVLQDLAASSNLQHAGHAHVPRLLDYFSIQGPNGDHRCTVTDIVGMSVGDLVSDHCKKDRLPAKLARSFARQALVALDYLHEHEIAHGDVHVRNIALTLPSTELLSEEAFMAKLRQPTTGTVSRADNQPLKHGIPRYLVRSAHFPVDVEQTTPQIKLVDFGEAFALNQPPSTLHTPLVVRPPEAIFEDRLGLEVDVWSMGCMIFELITGQPPFDNLLITKPSLVQQMLGSTGDQFPDRWKPALQAMGAGEDKSSIDDADISLQNWLSEVYFDEDKQAEFSQAELFQAGQLILSMCRMEPGQRISIKQALASPWLKDR